MNMIPAILNFKGMSAILVAAIAFVISPIAKSANPQQQDFEGMWKSKCSDNFGFQIKSLGNELYSVSFCGPGGCFKPGTYRPNTKIVGDPLYELVSPTTLKLKQPDGGAMLVTRCSVDPTPKTQKNVNEPEVKAQRSAVSDVPFAATEAGRKLIADFAVTSVLHYEIRGDKADDLAVEMRAKGHGGNGTTTGKVDYSFMCQRADVGYAIRSIASTCLATIRLPKWHGLDKAAPEMQKTWTAYYNKLRVHEMGHVAICAGAAKSVREALESVPSSPECNGIHALAKSKATNIIRDMQTKQEKYDADTLFGSKE